MSYIPTQLAHIGYVGFLFSYVLERMTMAAVEKRLAAILDKDWHSEAEALEMDW